VMSTVLVTVVVMGVTTPSGVGVQPL
jgi:hypothetical protein